jgi:hypothetical protein
MIPCASIIRKSGDTATIIPSTNPRTAPYPVTLPSNAPTAAQRMNQSGYRRSMFIGDRLPDHTDEARRLLYAKALRSQLDIRSQAAWGRVMASIDRTYPPNFRFNHWLTEVGCHKGVPAKWLIAIVLTGLLLVSSLG